MKLVFSSLDDVMRQADVSVKSLQAIANADGFSSLNINRRQALWEVRRLGSAPAARYALIRTCWAVS